MGETGPCGGCTEIHFLPPGAAPSFSNTMELWNLVFIEYRRDADGTLHKLDKKHVDTGMGFERLVSVLEGTNSNYDTDLFLPLFHAVEKMTGRPSYSGCYGNELGAKLDTAYRILADHSRMITVCLADGFYPDQENKLRGIIRKALTVARGVFGSEENLLQQLSTIVADILGDAYPELPQKLNRVHYIIEQEAELLRSMRQIRLNEWNALCKHEPKLRSLAVDECPNLLPAYTKFRESLTDFPPTNGVAPVELVWKLCETYGVPQNLAYQLAMSVDLNLDEQDLERHIVKTKEEARKEMYATHNVAKKGLSLHAVNSLRTEGVPVTDDSFKYNYWLGFGDVPDFPDQPANIVALLVDGDVVDYVTPELLMVNDCEIGIILDRTNMYSEAGGQVADHGSICLENGETLIVEHVSQNAGFVVHWIRCPAQSRTGLVVNSQGKVSIDKGRRTALMKNHTATHLLNAALRKSLTIVDQKSSRVYPHKLSFDFSVYRENLNLSELSHMEDCIRKLIRQGAVVKRKTIRSNDLPTIDHLTSLPGETYHHNNIHIIEIDSSILLSREPCCGTHSLNTAFLEDFVITNYKNVSTSVKSIQAVTGENAASARTNSRLFRNTLKDLDESVTRTLLKSDRCEEEVEHCDKMLVDLLRQLENTELLSFVDAQYLHDDMEKLRIRLKYAARSTLINSMEDEMNELLTTNTSPFLVHNLGCASNLDSVPLSKATRMSSSIPTFIFAGNGGVFKARCTVPQEMVSDTFSAEIWMSAVAKELKANSGPPKGQDAALVSNMKAKKLSKQQLEKAMETARNLVQSAIGTQ